MKRIIGRWAPWLARRAENIAALMLAAMFAAFLIQIVFRYLLNLPIGWTHEISVILWVWLVLWGAAFVLGEREEIRFDILYAAAGKRLRRVLAAVAALAVVLLYGTALPAMVDYVSFMRVERTAYMKIPFNWVYAIFIVFAVASIARYLWLGFAALRGEMPDDDDPTKRGSGT
ncbi:TRAP transporter small permease [Phreatobacter sp.]|uniref:TRAP transporter small permease n=1 Tax=Phreatobacter sp. TaxID=1966341 RepID=UPI003F7135B1